jgi:uncharacterized sulfatase
MQKPNFIVLITDSQGANQVGAYGTVGLQTDRIDALADRGVLFDRAYTTTPICGPARAGLFTGISPHLAGTWGNHLPLGANIKTMGNRFSDAGYHTAFIGKWHLDGHDYFGTGSVPAGWDPDYWYDGKNYLDDLSKEEIKLWRGGLVSIEDLEKNDIDASFTWAHRNSNRAQRFLKESSGKESPFLLVVSYDEPHHPFVCPPEYAREFAEYPFPLGPQAHDTLDGKPAYQREWADASGFHFTDGYIVLPLLFGCNSYVDHEIGRVVDAANRYSPHNTWIIFTSDHGEIFGGHQLIGKGPAMYEEITRIPLIMRPPLENNDIVPGRKIKTPVSHLDVLPTMLALAGMETPPILEGENMIPVMAGEERLHRPVFVEYNRFEVEHDSFGGFFPIRSVVQDDMKLSINLLSTDELYDLANDPGELNNLIDDPAYHDKRDRLHDTLLDRMYAVRDPFRTPYWERRPWRTKKSLELTWQGKYRPRPDDGYSPPFRDYDTGLPSKGVKVEFEGADTGERSE